MKTLIIIQQDLSLQGFQESFKKNFGKRVDSLGLGCL